MHFEIVGEVANVETIAVGGRIRDIMRLRRQFGSGRWRKLKGVAVVRLSSGRTRTAEVHWYEAHGIGRKKMKVKRFPDSRGRNARYRAPPAQTPACSFPAPGSSVVLAFARTIALRIHHMLTLLLRDTGTGHTEARERLRECLPCETLALAAAPIEPFE